MGKFSVVLTPFDKFSGHSKVRFGVGEEVKVDVTETPPSNPAPSLEWSVKSGSAAVHNGKVAGQGTLKCGNKPGAVVLELRNTKDKSLVATQRLEVVAPTGAQFKHKPINVAHGAGFQGEIYLEPTDVSFKWVEMREGEAPYEGTGCFAKVKLADDELAKSYAVVHPVMGSWVKCQGGASKNKMIGSDKVTSAIPADYGDGGRFQWKIPWFYRVHGVNGEFRFLTAVHQETVDKTGKMTISKLNAKVSKQL
jgi:hypothetical protein